MIFSQLLHQVKEEDMLIIEASMINLERFIPDIGVSNMERHLPLASEVSVRDVLSQPVLGKYKKFLRDRCRQTSHSCKEGIVFVDMLVLVSIRISAGSHEQFLLMNKVVFIRLKTRCQQISIFWGNLQICDTGEKRLVYVVHVFIKNCKESVPLERLWNGVNFRHFTPVVKFCDLFSNWSNSTFHSVHDSQVSVSMIGNVVSIIRDSTEHSLFIAEVFVENMNHVVPDCLIFTVSFTCSDRIKKYNMFVIKFLDIDKERLVPHIRIRNNIMSAKKQFSSVGKVCVLDVLCQPVLGPVSHIRGEWDVSFLELCLEVIMFQVMAIAVIVRNLAEFRLFVVKVHTEKSLAVSNNSLI